MFTIRRRTACNFDTDFLLPTKLPPGCHVPRRQHADVPASSPSEPVTASLFGHWAEGSGYGLSLSPHLKPTAHHPIQSRAIILAASDRMTRSGSLLLGLTAIVAVMVAVVAFAVLRFFAAARAFSRRNRQDGNETAFMAGAMEEAVQHLRVQERAMKARAEASERLSSEIIASMTSGLLVVGEDRQVRSLNPAGRRMLAVSHEDTAGDFRHVLGHVAPLADVVDECLQTAQPVLRRAVKLPQGGGASHLGITVSPIRDEAGHSHGAICLFSDLSEIADLEDQLRLKDSLARLGEMTAGIAHEFRNGLATIHGYARLLDSSGFPRNSSSMCKAFATRPKPSARWSPTS